MTNSEFIESIRLKGEEWRDVVFNPRYAVSSLGRVVAYSAPYEIGSKLYHRKPKLMKPYLSGNYLMVKLSNGHKEFHNYMVHRLVAQAFISNPNNYSQVNHKDENTQNNCAGNLEWCTPQYNSNYGTRNERMGRTLSKTTPCRKCIIQLSLDNEYIGEFESVKEACIFIGVCKETLRAHCIKTDTPLKGYKWMYASDYYGQSPSV